MKKYPKIINWNVLKDQFGLITEPGYKSAKDISRDLTFINTNYDFKTASPGDHQVLKYGLSVHKANDEHEMSIVAINYQLDNDDSGIAIFEYKGDVDGESQFEYTGTAK